MPGRGRGAGRGAGRGIAKASHNSTSQALGKAIAAARTQQQTKVSASLHLHHLSETATEEEETTTESILELVREVFSEAEGSTMALTLLGEKVRNLAMRRSLHTAHKHVKDKFGGWESFLRVHAAGEYSVTAGLVRAHAQPAATSAAAGDVDSMEVQPRAASADVSRSAINALSLDAAAL